MKDGKYKIVHISHDALPGTEIGAFEIVNAKIKNRSGLARELFVDGPVTPRVEFQVRRLHNGYNSVVWERPVAGPPQHSHPPPRYE